MSLYSHKHEPLLPLTGRGRSRVRQARHREAITLGVTLSVSPAHLDKQADVQAPVIPFSMLLPSRFMRTPSVQLARMKAAVAPSVQEAGPCRAVDRRHSRLWVIRRVFRDHSVVPTRHDDLAPRGTVRARDPVKEAEQRLVRVDVEVVDLAAARDEVRVRREQRFADDGRRHHVGHVPEVVLGRNVQVRACVEPAHGRHGDVAAQNNDAGGVRAGDLLQAVDEVLALLAVCARGVVVKGGEEGGAGVVAVEVDRADAGFPGQVADGAHERASENALYL